MVQQLCRQLCRSTMWEGLELEYAEWNKCVWIWIQVIRLSSQVTLFECRVASASALDDSASHGGSRTTVQVAASRRKAFARE